MKKPFMRLSASGCARASANFFSFEGAPLSMFCWLALIAFAAIAALPAAAVQVWSLGDNIEQPPGTPPGQPHLLVSGLMPAPQTLPGHRHLNVRVLDSVSAEPIANAMVYLVRSPWVEQTVIFNTDSKGEATLWNIDGCYKKLVVTDGAVSIKQFVCLPADRGTSLVVKWQSKRRSVRRLVLPGVSAVRAHRQSGRGRLHLKRRFV